MKLILDQMETELLKEIVNSEVDRKVTNFDFRSHSFPETEFVKRVYLSDGYHYEDEWMKIVSLCENELKRRGCVPVDIRNLDGKEIPMPDGKHKVKVMETWAELYGPYLRTVGFGKYKIPKYFC